MDRAEVCEETESRASDGEAQRWSRSSEEESEVALVHSTATLEYPCHVKRSSLTEIFLPLSPCPEASKPEAGEEADTKAPGEDLCTCPPDICLQPLALPAGQEPPSEEEEGVRVFSPTVFVVSPGEKAWPVEREGLELSEVEALGREVHEGEGGVSRPLFDELPPNPAGGEWGSRAGGRGRSRACSCCTRAKLKTMAAVGAAILLYPCLLYGAYIFLPFDVPILPELSSRALYALRCSVFATVPIVLGLMVYGLAKLCSPIDQPFGKLQLQPQVQLHRRFVRDSIHLFLLFVVNLMAIATFLPQEALKLVPLLTAFFALSRLIYWVVAAFSSRLRGFGYGLSFFPIIGLLIANLFFLLQPHQLIAIAPGGAPGPEKPRQRFWG